MTRPPLTRIDGEPVPAQKPPPPALEPPPAPRPPRASRPIGGGPGISHLAARLPAPQIWLGAACVAILLVMLALPTGGQETGRSPLAGAVVQGPVVATLQLPGSDLRPVRQVCDDEGLPAELCARSAACAPPPPTTAAPAPRVIRLFLRTPPTGGCP